MLDSAKCRAAVEQAIGRQLTNKEVADIKAKIADATKGLAIKDPAKWRGLTQVERDAAVAKKVGEQIILDAVIRKKRADNQSIATTAIDDYIDDYIARVPKHGANEAVRRTLANVQDLRGGVESVDTLGQAIATNTLRQFITEVYHLGPKLWGLVKNKEGRDALVNEAHILGSSGNAAAKHVTEVWNKVVEDLRLRWNAAGGKAGRLAGTYLPTDHDSVKINKAVREHRTILGVESNKWVEDNQGRFKRDTFVDADGNLLSDEEYIKKLTNMSRTLASHGYSKDEMLEPYHGDPKIANRDHHRRLHFNNAADEIAYREDYANPNIVASMVGHVWKMARDIALVERFGPNVEGMWKHIEGRMKHDLSTRLEMDGGQIDGEIAKIRRLWDEVTASDGSISNRLARGFSEFRALIASIRLGKILINSLADQGVMRVIAGLNSLDQLKLNEAQAKGLASSEYLDALHAYGYGLDNLISQLNRMGEQNFGMGVSARMANFLIGSTGHMRVERAGRAAFEAMMAKALTSTVAKHATLADVPEASGYIIKQSGVTEQTWEVLRNVVPTDVNGMKLITADGISAVDAKTLSGLAKKYGVTVNRLVWDAQDQLIGLQLDQSHRAIVTPKANELAAIRGKSGTWGGEIWNSIFLFKSFPIAQMMHMRHTAAGIKGPGKVGYVAAHVAAATALGYLSLQIGELLSGRDPRSTDMTSIEGYRTLFAAMLKGGSLGFYGDFLYAPMNRYNQSFLSGMLGPVAGLAEQSLNITQGVATRKLMDALSGEEVDRHWDDDLVRFAKGNIPILGSHFILKPLLDHLIFYNLQEMAAPGYIERMKYRAQREYHQGYYWEPADLLPSRAPDFSKMLPTGE